MTTAPTTDAAAKKDLAKLQRAIVDGLEDVKAGDIRVFDTTHLSPLFERVIIASGNTNRQTKALAASVRDKVRDAGFTKPRSEGEDNGEWIIIDCGAAVCHIMQPAIRAYYRLEEIWGDKPVRMKLGAALPRNLTAPQDDAPRPARKAAAKTANRAASKTAVKAPARKAPAKKTATPTTAGQRGATARPAPTQTPVAKTAKPRVVAKKAPAKKAAPVKTVLVNAPTARKTAAKAPARKAPAKKAPSRKA